MKSNEWQLLYRLQESKQRQRFKQSLQIQVLSKMKARCFMLLGNKGEMFSVTFNEAGSYDYICSFHNGMDGIVIVE